MTVRRKNQESTTGAKKKAPGIVVTLLGVAFLALIATQWRDRQVVSNVEIDGASPLSRQAIQQVTSALVGKPLKNIELADVRKAIEALPYVQDAAVYVSGIRSIKIGVQERLPLGHAVLSDGSLRYIDDNGYILPNVGVHGSHNIPVVQTTAGGQLSTKELHLVATMLKSAKIELDPVLYQSISEVLYDRRNANLVLRTDHGAWKLGSCTADHVSSAFADMNVFWKNEATRCQLANDCFVDLRWNHQIIIRKSGWSA